jgi:Carboxypeptidase regulatory-like domain/TonB dependent receptor
MPSLPKLLLLALLFTQAAHPQSAHQLTGTVQDPTDAVIVAASVEVFPTGETTPTAKTTTDNSGSFHFDHLTPGTYELHVQGEGFREEKLPVTIGTKPNPPLHITLSVYAANESVSVQVEESAAQISTDPGENQSANTIDRAALDRVPVFDQDYITTLSRFLDDNAIGTNGITLVVNGVEANGPGVTPSAIREVKINQNPYSALFSRPGRARLEITTKGGTPEFHGSLNFLFRDAVFDARNAFASIKPPEQRRYYEGSLTGPVGHSKKTTFLLSLENDNDDQQANVYAQTTPSTLIQENVSNPTHHFFGSGRVFHNRANGDQIWTAYSYEHETKDNQGVGGTVLPEAGSNTRSLEHEINVSYLHVFSPKWLNQLRFLVGYNDNLTKSLNANPQLIVSGAFTGGGAQADTRRTESHFDGTDVVSYANGKHELKFGIDIPDISRRGADDYTNRAGTYTFASLADYQAQNPATYLVQTGQGRAVFLEKVVSGFVEDNIRLRPNFSFSVGVRYYWQNYFHDDPSNFAPRFGFAYAPTPNSKTVLRGGAGEFYDRSGPRPIADLLHFNGVNLLRYIADNPTYPVDPSALVGLPASLVILDPRTKLPHTLQYSIGLERQLTKKSTLSATYVGSRGIDLFRSIDANAPLPSNPATRPNPNQGQVREIQPEGYQKSNSLELTFRGKATKYFSGQAQYTLSSTRNDTSGITYFPGNSYAPDNDWARSDNDRRHKFDLLGSAKPTKYFSVGLALSLYSGKPVNITSGTDSNGDGITNDRPLGVPRNSLHGPGTINLDLNVSHDFVLSKTKKEAPTLTVTLNSFNILNHRNDVTYSGVITSPFFGHATQAQPPRRTQIDVEFKF